MEPKTDKKSSGFLGGVVTAFLAILLVYIVQQRSDSASQKQLIEDLQKQVEELPKVPEEKIAFPDFYVATKEMKNITPIQDQKGYVQKTTQEIVGSEEVTISSSGSIARGYLYIEAAVDSGRPLTIYDSVYMKLNYVGGHLLRNKSLSVPVTAGTALLYPLNAVPYLPSIPYDESRTGRSADWVSILNTKNNPILLSFISTAREGGLIHKVMISYECTKESPSCSLSFTK